MSISSEEQAEKLRLAIAVLTGLKVRVEEFHTLSNTATVMVGVCTTFVNFAFQSDGTLRFTLDNQHGQLHADFEQPGVVTVANNDHPIRQESDGPAMYWEGTSETDRELKLLNFEPETPAV